MEKLFNKNFTIITVGQIISMLGNSIQRFAFSLFILEITGSASTFAVIISLGIIPTIILSPMGGAIADRMNKGKLMVILDFCAFGLIGLFIFFIFGSTHQVFMIGVLMILLSIINSIYDPVVHASIPAVTKPENFNKANSISTGITSLTNMIGPIIAGFFYGIFGLKIIMIINMISYFISAIMEMFLTIKYNKSAAENVNIKTYLVDIKETAKYLYFEKKKVLYIIFIAAGLNLFITPTYTVGVPYVEKVIFGVSDQLYGISEGIFGVGCIVGAGLIGLIAKHVPFEKLYKMFALTAVSIIIMGIPTISLISGSTIFKYIIFNFAGFLLTFFLSIINIQAVTYVQLESDQNKIGKVMALTVSLSGLFVPVGQVIFGGIYDILNYKAFPIYIVVALIAFICSKILYNIYAKNTIEKIKQAI